MPLEYCVGDDWHPTVDLGMLRRIPSSSANPTPRISMPRLPSFLMAFAALFVLNIFSACVSNPVPHPANGEGAAASGGTQGSTGSSRDLASSEEGGEDGAFAEENAEPSAGPADAAMMDEADAAPQDAASSDAQDGQSGDAGPVEDSGPNDVEEDGVGAD
jgi:hypothetical protein